MLLEQKKSVRRGVANCCCGIKITSKRVQKHQTIENPPPLFLEQKEVSKKRSGKLLFWNKNSIKTCLKTLINRKLTSYVVRTKRGQ